MTYCVAAAVDEGIVFLSDSRTNAGIDQVSEYPKCYRFVWPGERVIVVLSAGSLATTQLVMKQIEKDLQLTPTESQPEPLNLRTMNDLSDIAAYVGRISSEAQKNQRRTAPNVQLGASFIIGGQIKQGGAELYLVYPEGNFIEMSPSQRFLQIGETKYGKPILDRIIEKTTTLDDAARCCMVSMASTLRSNASVGFPLDLVVYRAGSLRLDQQIRFEGGDQLFTSMSDSWSQGLLQAFEMLPRFDWESPQQSLNIETATPVVNQQAAQTGFISPVNQAQTSAPAPAVHPGKVQMAEPEETYDPVFPQQYS